MVWLKDTAERVVRTFVQAYLGWWVALSGHDFSDLFGHQALLTGTSAAAICLLACLGASQVNKDGGALTASIVKDDRGDVTLMDLVIIATLVGVIALCLGWLPQ